MRRILNFLIFLLGLSGAIQALAQTPVPLPVQGNLGSISGSGVPYAGVDIQLQNCPSPVSISGYWGIVQQEYQVQADPSGNINTTVWPNDLITCNGTTGNSQYNLSLILNGVVQGTPQCYQVVSTQGLWNLNTQQPITCSQPAPNPQDKTFNNLTVNGFFQGHNGDFSGTLDFGSANVPGKVCNVAFYGGIGNGIANDHDAIQLAVDTCYANGGSVYFPTRWTSTGQTVYYTATAINPKGVSMFGPPGASGPSGYYTNTLPVAVRGGVGQDVFNVVAAGSPGYVAPRPSFTVQDFAILVDDSTDNSAAFTTRRPGRSCDDASMTGSNGVLTSSTQCEFQPGDVGQAITVAGAGSAGATLSTTIASWQSATQVTLTASSATAVTNATTYISVYGLPVTQNIGNCGFAYDDPAGAYSGPQIIKALFRDLVVDTISNNPTNNTCGFFFQGNQAPTWSRWENNFVGTTFGFNYVPVSTAAPTNSTWTGMADYNKWDHIYLWSNYPFLSYSAQYQEISQMQIAFEKAGPHIISAYGLEPEPQWWTIDIPEMEPDSGCAAGTDFFRISGHSHTVSKLGIGGCTAGYSTFQWDARGSTVADLHLGYINEINITGDINKFTIPYAASILPFATTTITGSGNLMKMGNDSSPYDGIQPARFRYAPNGPTDFGPPQLSRGSVVFDRKADFLNTGGSAYYFNAEDLWMWPKEMGGPFGGATSTVSDDADSASGTALLVPLGGSAYYISEINGTDLTTGSQVPASKMRVYISAKAASPTDLYAEAAIYYSGVWNSIGNATFSSLTSGYVTYAFDIDATGYSGDLFRITLGGHTTPTVDTYVAWIGIRPWGDTLSSSLTLGSGVAMTANQGNGTSMQHSTGSTTTNDCVKFDANGNTIDAGVSCSASGGFSSGSNANGRWVTDPTGTTTERGCISVTAGGSTHVTGAVTFPLTFPTALDSLTGSPNNAPDGGDSGTAAASLWFTSTGTSGATANYRCVVDVGGGGCAAISNTVPICWIAIGR